MTKPERRAAALKLAQDHQTVTWFTHYHKVTLTHTIKAIRNKARSLCGRDEEMWREFTQAIGEQDNEPTNRTT